MKTVLYAGAALMIGASIYGFVDLKNKSQQKEFKTLYKEEKAKTPVVTEAGKTTRPMTVPEEKTANTVPAKKMVKKEEAPKTMKSLKPVSAEDRPETSTVKNIEETFVGENLDPSNDVDRKLLKKKKRLSTKLFSRAPIREEINFTSEPLTPAKEAKDAKKITKE